MGNFVTESCSDSIVMLLPPKNITSDCEHDNNRTKLEKIKLKQTNGKKNFPDNIFASIARIIIFIPAICFIPDS